MNRLFAPLAAAALALGGPAAHAVAQQQPARPAVAPAATAAPAPATAAKPAATPAKKERGGAGPLGSLGGSNSKEPIKIDADRLDVFDKEGKAVFKGNVVAVQGETTMRCTTLTVFYERQSQKDAAQAGAPKPQPAAAAAASPNDSVKHIDCAGPVTVVSKDQIATSDNATFDRVANKVVLTGNAALSQCQNVTRGERIVYDLNTGVANVETTPGGRVKALFVPGNDDKQKQGCEQPQQQAAPAQPAAAPPK
ncbi:MAG TPA: lipopolysaccharide transport periplasmic protein LptA, partial [Beijerinckiaceae bacterium]